MYMEQSTFTPFSGEGGRYGHLGEGGREGHMGEGGTFKGGGRDIWGRGGKEGHLVGYLVDTSRAGCSYVV